MLKPLTLIISGLVASTSLSIQAKSYEMEVYPVCTTQSSQRVADNVPTKIATFDSKPLILLDGRAIFVQEFVKMKKSQIAEWRTNCQGNKTLMAYVEDVDLFTPIEMHYDNKFDFLGGDISTKAKIKTSFDAYLIDFTYDVLKNKSFLKDPNIREFIKGDNDYVLHYVTDKNAKSSHVDSFNRIIYININDIETYYEGSYIDPVQSDLAQILRHQIIRAVYKSQAKEQAIMEINVLFDQHETRQLKTSHFDHIVKDVIPEQDVPFLRTAGFTLVAQEHWRDPIEEMQHQTTPLVYDKNHSDNDYLVEQILARVNYEDNETEPKLPNVKDLSDHFHERYAVTGSQQYAIYLRDEMNHRIKYRNNPERWYLEKHKANDKIDSDHYQVVAYREPRVLPKLPKINQFLTLTNEHRYYIAMGDFTRLMMINKIETMYEIAAREPNGNVFNKTKPLEQFLSVHLLKPSEIDNLVNKILQNEGFDEYIPRLKEMTVNDTVMSGLVKLTDEGVLTPEDLITLAKLHPSYEKYLIDRKETDDAHMMTRPTSYTPEIDASISDDDRIAFENTLELRKQFIDLVMENFHEQRLTYKRIVTYQPDVTMQELDLFYDKILFPMVDKIMKNNNKAISENPNPLHFENMVRALTIDGREPLSREDFKIENENLPFIFYTQFGDMDDFYNEMNQNVYLRGLYRLYLAKAITEKTFNKGYFFNYDYDS